MRIYCNILYRFFLKTDKRIGNEENTFYKFALFEALIETEMISFHSIERELFIKIFHKLGILMQYFLIIIVIKINSIFYITYIIYENSSPKFKTMILFATSHIDGIKIYLLYPK